MDYKGMVHDCLFRSKSFQTMHDGEGYVHEMQCKKAIEELLRRLENVERERDTAVEQLHGICSACAHYTPYHNDGPCATCTHEVACFVPEKATDKWEWNGGSNKK